jgi:outer membrane protein assembly factor BamB
MAAYAGNVVYALNGGSLTALDASTGQPQWTFVGDATLQFPPVIAAGHVYVASANNTYAVDVTTGTQVWTDSLGGWLAVVSGKLLVARTNGTLAAYDLSHP